LAARLGEAGGPHHRAPDKTPERRLATLEAAGEARVPFTTGLLVGFGETREERIETLLAIEASHRRHGHVQEVIVQNFLPKPGRGPPPTSASRCRARPTARGWPASTCGSPAERFLRPTFWAWPVPREPAVRWARCWPAWSWASRSAWRRSSPCSAPAAPSWPP